MKRLVLSLATAAALLGPTLAGTALAQDVRPQLAPNGNPAFYAQNHPGWNRGRFDTRSLDGRWVADDHSGDARGGRGMMRQMLLPDLITIDQKPSMLRITDQRNQPLQTIMLGGKFDSRRGHGNDRPDYVVGRWDGSMLVVERATPRGGTITQTFSLENRGHNLVVRTKREGQGPRTLEITTTYRRA
jgi:hypothetical protein